MVEVLIKICIPQYTSTNKYTVDLSFFLRLLHLRSIEYFGMMSEVKKKIITFSPSQIFTKTFTTENHELFLLA